MTIFLCNDYCPCNRQSKGLDERDDLLDIAFCVSSTSPMFRERRLVPGVRLNQHSQTSWPALNTVAPSPRSLETPVCAVFFSLSHTFDAVGRARWSRRIGDPEISSKIRLDSCLCFAIVRDGAAARGRNGALEMAKHRQNKGTKKHVKNRPRKVSVHPTDSDSGLHYMYRSLVVAVGAVGAGGVCGPLPSLS